MGLFEQFPYTNFHELNLDWIIDKINTVLSTAVISVNGETGEVILYKDPSVHFPDINANQWNVFRISDGSATGIEFNKNAPATRISGANRYQIYDQGNPPPYPVLSVNGATGAVTLYQDPSVHYPDISATSWNVYRVSDGVATGIEFNKNAPAVRIDGANRYQIYDQGNPPPYPVTSVDGATGAIIQWFNTSTPKLHLPISSAYTDWTMVRELSNNTELGLRIAYNTNTQKYEAFISYTEYGGTEQFVRLLTPDDIPSASGVVSFNGQTGVVIATGADLHLNYSNTDSIDTYIGDRMGDIAYLIQGNTAGTNVPAGGFVFVKDSTITGIPDGLYTSVNAISSGTPFTSADLTVVASGGLNALGSELNNKAPYDIINTGSESFVASVFSGYITGSGNYTDFFVPIKIRPGHTVTSVTLGTSAKVYTPSDAFDRANISATIIHQGILGLLLEVPNGATKTPNQPATVYAPLTITVT